MWIEPLYLLSTRRVRNLSALRDATWIRPARPTATAALLAALAEAAALS
jgi:hypothetical protein